jgi:aminoglycoside phosphotransferase (APT) family kinase protein
VLVPQFDVQALTSRATASARRRWPEASVSAAVALPGGVSSLTYRATLAVPGKPELPIVLKVAPPGLPPVLNRDVLRQARIIRLLGAADGVRVPTVLFEDAGRDEESPMFAMTLVDGESYEPLLDVAEHPPAAETVTERAMAAARMLAHMQALDPKTLGVGDELVVSPSEELDRWARLLATVDDDIAPRHAELHAALAERVPEPVAPTLLHGDYRLANMIFAGSDLAAIIDWEIWSVGDPRTDLAWLLMHTNPAHRFRTERPIADIEAASGMPSPAALVDAYREVRDAPLRDIDWFLACCFYKTASTVSVVAKRNRRRKEPDPSLEIVAASIPTVVERGLALLARARSG